jgi:hypothetical protein
MILKLANKVLVGEDRFVKDARSGLKIVKVRDHLIIYRHGELKLWVDMELKYLVAWHINTQAEVTAFNKVLDLINIRDHYEFIRSGRTVLLQAGNKFYRVEEYNDTFGPDSRGYSFARQSSSTPGAGGTVCPG